MTVRRIPENVWEDLIDVLETYQFSYDEEGTQYNVYPVQQLLDTLKELPHD